MVGFVSAVVQIFTTMMGLFPCCLQVNVEEVKREHKEAADRVVEAVHTALAEGLHQQRKQAAGSKSSSGDGSSGTSQ